MEEGSSHPTCPPHMPGPACPRASPTPTYRATQDSLPPLPHLHHTLDLDASVAPAGASPTATGWHAGLPHACLYAVPGLPRPRAFYIPASHALLPPPCHLPYPLLYFTYGCRTLLPLYPFTCYAGLPHTPHHAPRAHTHTTTPRTHTRIRAARMPHHTAHTQLVRVWDTLRTTHTHHISERQRHLYTLPTYRAAHRHGCKRDA